MSYAGMTTPGWLGVLARAVLYTLVACAATPQFMQFAVATGRHIAHLKFVRVLPPCSSTVEKIYAAVSGYVAFLPFMPWPRSSLASLWPADEYQAIQYGGAKE